MATALGDTTSLQLKLRNILLLCPLKRRVLELANLFPTCSFKELQAILPILIDTIFGVTPGYGPFWNLRNITKHDFPDDFEAVMLFLHPQGPLMDVIYKLLSDTLLKYEYPLSHLPSSFRAQIDQGIVPSYFTEKFFWHPQTRIPMALQLNPYELFIYHFVFHLVTPWQVGPEKTQDKPLETVYLNLCDHYMYHLFPIGTSIVLPEIYVHQAAPRSLPQVQHVSKLFKQSALNLATAPVISQPHGEIWRSEIYLNVIIQFWLAVTEVKLQDSFNSSYLSQSPGLSPTCSKPYFNMADDNSRLPDQLRAIRNMIKHMHYFSNNIRNDNSCLDELRKNIRSIFKSHIFNFLQHRMRHWPLDNSFLLILETYLSYIQPWRYLNYDPKSLAGQSRNVDTYWMPFLNDNLPSYTVIVRQILMRFSRMDLTSSRSALMVFRLAKVFREPNLPDFLWTLCERDQQDPTLNLFTPDTTKIVWELMLHMKQIERKFKDEKSAESHSDQSETFFNKIRQWFLLTDANDVTIERNKTLGYLNMSITYLSEIFRVNPPEDADLSCSANGLTDSNLQHQDFPISPEQARKRCENLKYEGNPDLMPIQSYEITSWVRALHRFSTILNQTYGSWFEEIYNGSDLLSRMAHQLLTPPCRYYYFDKTGPGQIAPRRTQQLPPRVCLRPLARRRVATAIACAVAFPFTPLTAMHPITFYLVLMLLFVVVVILKATLMPWRRRVRGAGVDRREFESLDTSFNE